MSNKEEKRYPFWHVAPHVVILGAGASKAAFPNGDKNGRELPLMQDFVEVLNLGPALSEYDIEYEGVNFEKIYDELYQSNEHPELLKYVENSVREYFSKFEIPNRVTLYDELILSLREKDHIYTFNWDPLLLQAYRRHSKIKKLPKIHFLHGNVAVGICKKHKTVGYIKGCCSKCGNPYSPVRLLYPVADKDYDSSPFISSEWKHLEWVLERSFMLTIFGYSAPKTDVVAKKMMGKAWDINDKKNFNEIEIIDIKSEEELHDTWSDFIVSHHYSCWESIRDSLIFRYPRRSCVAWGESIMQLDPWKDNHLPEFNDIAKLQKWLSPLLRQEVDFDEEDKRLTDLQSS